MITTTTHVVDIVSFRAGQVTFFNSVFTSLRKFCILANTFALHFKNQQIERLSFTLSWQARRDSNPQHPVLETGALAVRATGLHKKTSRQLHTPILFGFFMQSMCSAKTAVLLKL